MAVGAASSPWMRRSDLRPVVAGEGREEEGEEGGVDESVEGRSRRHCPHTGGDGRRISWRRGWWRRVASPPIHPEEGGARDLSA